MNEASTINPNIDTDTGLPILYEPSKEAKKATHTLSQNAYLAKVYQQQALVATSIQELQLQGPHEYLDMAMIRLQECAHWLEQYVRLLPRTKENATLQSQTK